MERTILHCDMNSFYASVECMCNPSISDKPVAVGGSEEKRTGIILAKNQIAKKYNVKTGETLWQARQKCPHLIVVPPDFKKYIHFSKMASKIYNNYTNLVESFGFDECWLDVTGTEHLFGNGEAVAETIRKRIKSELGITCSIGVSFNKVFAKLGSDMKKPDAVTLITKKNYKSKVWPLPVEDLLFVGKVTKQKLNRYGIKTIGDLARTDFKHLETLLGKWGYYLWGYANGLDASPVRDIENHADIKSIGNSITAPRDLMTINDIKIILYKMAESVTERLRENNLMCATVQLWVKDNELKSYERQAKLIVPCAETRELFNTALALYLKNHKTGKPVRALGVRAHNLLPSGSYQLSLDPEINKIRKREQLEETIDTIRQRFGHHSIQRCITLTDTGLSNINPKDEHTVHPIAWPVN